MKLSLGITPRDYSVAGGAVVYDADALAYFTANTAITSAADKNAINTFYLGLKSDGIYTKIKAMYLPIWGSAATSKWNLVNPLDTNAAFRLTFATGWTFSSGGMTPNGLTYSNTQLNPRTIITNVNSSHLSYYSRTNVNTDVYTIGSFETTNTFSLYANYLGTFYSRNYNGTNGGLTSSVPSGNGFFMTNRNAVNVHNIWRNGSKLATNTNSTSLGTTPNSNVYIGGIDATNYDSLKQCSFASIGNGLSDTEASNFYNRVQTLMSYFGINV